MSPLATTTPATSFTLLEPAPTEQAASAARRRPWLALVVVHCIGLAIAAVLFFIAAVAEGTAGEHFGNLAAGWVMAGVVVVPLTTFITAIWWYWKRNREPLPPRPEPRPYDGLPVTASSLQREPTSSM